MKRLGLFPLKLPPLVNEI